jgi:DNA-binding Xre family transcriptional regulator
MEIDVFDKIQRLAERRGISMRKLILAVGLSQPGYYKMQKANDIKFSTLEKILNFLRVPIEDFFNKDIMDLLNEDRSSQTVSSIKEKELSNTDAMLIEKDLKMMENVIQSIRETISN